MKKYIYVIFRKNINKNSSLKSGIVIPEIGWAASAIQ